MWAEIFRWAPSPLHTSCKLPAARLHGLACLGAVRAVTQNAQVSAPAFGNAPSATKWHPCRVCRLTRAGDLWAHKLQHGAWGAWGACTWPLETFLGSDNSGRSAVCAKRVMGTHAPMRCLIHKPGRR